MAWRDFLVDLDIFVVRTGWIKSYATEGLRKVTGDGEEKDRLARQAELFGDDFTPSINQLSPLLSLLPLPVAWHGPEGVVALSHAL